MKAATLFSGIGGFDLPLQRKGVELGEAVEIDKYARSVYSRHFPRVRLWQDATKIEPERLSEFDILACGPPCQSFSVAGNRRGFTDTRGTLFYEVFKAILIRSQDLSNHLTSLHTMDHINADILPQFLQHSSHLISLVNCILFPILKLKEQSNLLFCVNY